MVDKFGCSGALYQCALGADSQKPTRLATNLAVLKKVFDLGMAFIQQRQICRTFAKILWPYKAHSTHWHGQRRNI
eukprot:1432329-Karenia_brevis.AAC.1